MKKIIGIVRELETEKILIVDNSTNDGSHFWNNWIYGYNRNHYSLLDVFVSEDEEFYEIVRAKFLNRLEEYKNDKK